MGAHAVKASMVTMPKPGVRAEFNDSSNFKN
jgi:hypothetical protein